MRVEHEIHHRRKGRNMGVLILLLAFVALVFALTVVKVTRTDFGNAPVNTGGEASQ